jgi:ABC-type transporter lipoprotein component MlaA
MSTIFLQMLVFDGINFRTPRINKAVRLIVNISMGLGGLMDENSGLENKAKSSIASR